jgi:hypothetical protein
MTQWPDAMAVRPLLLGAETDGGKVVRHFRGELEEVALWTRALTDEDIRLLARPP